MPLKILVVESNQTDGQLIENCLHQHGLVAHCHCVTSLESLKKALDKKGWSVVLCDDSVAKQDFHETLKFLHSQYSDLPVILLVSGFHDEEIAVELLKQGVWDVVFKNRMVRLAPAIERSLREAADRLAQRANKLTLLESELRFRTLFEQAPVAIGVSRDGIGIYSNRKFLQIFGLHSVEEVIGRQLFEFYAPQCQEEIKERIRQRSLGLPVPLDYESIGLRSDGSMFSMHVAIDQVELPDGKANVGFITDITDRKRVEETLFQTNVRVRHLNNLLNAIQDVGSLLSSNKNSGELLTAVCQSLIKTRGYVTVWVGQPDPESKQVLPVAHSGVGSTAFLQHAPITWDESPSGQGPTGTAIREHRPVVFNDIAHDPRFAPWRDAVIGGGGASIASIPITHDERLFGVLTIKATSANAFDKEEVDLLTGLASSVARALRNIEEEAARRKAEENQQRLATAVEQAAESIVITDTRGAIVYANPAFEKNSGYTLAEAIGQNPRILKSGRQDAEFYRSVWSTIARGNVWQGHFTNKRKDGTLYEEEATISPIFDTTGKIVNYVAVKRDISREVQLEEQVRQSQKMEAIGQLAGGIAHDFNNILAAMLLRTEIIEVHEGLPDEVRDGLQEIRSSAERAANLTRQLLLFSRRQVMQRRDLDLNDVITNLAKMLRRIIGADIQMLLQLSSKPLIAHADAGMLDQVLLNLVVNARDAMPAGGRLVVETGEKIFTPEETASMPDVVHGRKVFLRVTDTGAGIAPEVLPRIFEPFFTTKEVGKGTGLGLATVFGIVKQHGGSIGVESEIGRGSSFQLFLPGIDKAEQSLEQAPAKPKARGGTETILLVEDDQFVRLLAHSVLKQAGYKVLEATNGVEALAIEEEYRDSINLLLTDLVMPEGVSGRELADQLRRRNPKLRVIFTSGYSAEIGGRDISLWTGQNFIQKPFASHQLLHAVRQCLDS